MDRRPLLSAWQEDETTLSLIHAFALSLAGRRRVEEGEGKEQTRCHPQHRDQPPRVGCQGHVGCLMILALVLVPLNDKIQDERKEHQV